ncbi:MAG: hypothetical protein ACREQ1_13085, partial [Woeseiaceae bacterium]
MNKPFQKLTRILVLSLASVTVLPGPTAATAEADGSKAWTVEDSFRTMRLRDLQVSPDGDRLLFVMSERD